MSDRFSQHVLDYNTRLFICRDVSCFEASIHMATILSATLRDLRDVSSIFYRCSIDKIEGGHTCKKTNIERFEGIQLLFRTIFEFLLRLLKDESFVKNVHRQ